MKDLFGFRQDEGDGYSRTVKWIGGAAALVGGLSVLFGATVWALKSAFPTHEEMLKIDAAQKAYHDRDLAEKLDAEHKFLDIRLRLQSAEIAKQVVDEIEKRDRRRSNLPGSEKKDILSLNFPNEG